MGVNTHFSESTVNNLHKQLESLTQAGMFTLDARRFLQSGHPILSEIAALQTKLDAENRQYDLNSLPDLESDYEKAKADARRVRDRVNKHLRGEIDVKRNHDTLHESYKNACNKLAMVQSEKLDKFASKAEIEEHDERVRKVAREVNSYQDKLSDEYLDRNGYYNELAKLQAEYTVADNAVTHAKHFYEAVAKRVGVLAEDKPQANNLGFIS